MASTVPQPTFGPNGLIVPEESDILTAVCNDLNTAFGGTLNLDPTDSATLATPQGQLASSMAAIIADKNNLLLQYISQVDPQYAQGRMQDAIGNIYGIQRVAATYTMIVCRCYGVIGTLIPDTAQIQDSYGNIYQTNVVQAIGGTGYSDINFYNIVAGAIPYSGGLPPVIYTPVSGWDSVDEPSGSNIFLGLDAENQVEFEYRRQYSVSINSRGSGASIYSAVLGSGATLTPPNQPSDVLVLENTTNNTVARGGVSLKAHSIYVAVIGGDNNAIAQAIYDKISCGCDTNGSTSVTIYDQNYEDPKPGQVINFQVATEVPIYFRVVIIGTPTTPSNIQTLVKNAIIGAFIGSDGGAPIHIGCTLYASRYYAPILAVAPGIAIGSIVLGTTDPPNRTSLSVNINRYPSVIADNINVVIQ